MFEVLSQHPSREVREAVACIDSLTEVAIRHLVGDRCVDVVRALIERDTMVAEAVADKFGSYEQVDPEANAQKLFALKDTSIMAALVNSDAVPERVMLQLADHTDPEVRSRARKSLR